VTRKILPLFLLFAAIAALAQQDVTNGASSGTSPKSAGVYYAAFRTSAHISRSSPDIFHSVSQDLLAHLKSKGVLIVADPERGVLETSDQMSMESMLRLAKLAGASSLLLVTVDRPAASWIKITVQSFDETGKKLWEESADKKSGLSGKTAPHEVGEKIKSKLEAHLGKEGLPMATTASQATPSLPAAETQSKPQ
jgi:hypothetical protein